MNHLFTYCGQLRLVLIIGLAVAFCGKSQLRAQEGWCGTPHPSAEATREIVKEFEFWLETQGPLQNQVVNIPISFHIVWDGFRGLVSTEEIMGQLSVLNASFAQTNFQFYLESIDTTENDIWAWHCSSSPQEAAMKNALAIDPARVLNFYIVNFIGKTEANGNCNFAAENLGYAWWPWSFDEENTRHGIVVKYTTLPGGEPENNYDDGIVGVHEAGHFMGLYHTFHPYVEGGGDDGCHHPGDEIDDTPYESYPSYGCDERDTCPDDPGMDPIHNYMDYSPDQCRNEFTPLQSARMNTKMLMHRKTMTGVNIVVDQWDGNNNFIVGSTISRWESGWVDYTVGHDEPVFRFFPRTSEYLRGYQDLLRTPPEKYHDWKGFSDIRNFQVFVITTDFISRLTSQFKRTHDATIEARFIDGGSGDSIRFTDPWLIDFEDPIYGMRNRGLQAVPNPVNSAQNNLGISTGYKGVFMNEVPDPNDPNKPYYTIAAPATATINNIESALFIKWAGQYVTFQDSFALQTPLVFTGSNATASALYKAHLHSSSSAATASNTQRKIVRDNFGQFHMVYESANTIWYARRPNGTTEWQPEVLLSYTLPEYYHRGPAVVYKPGTGSGSIEDESSEGEPHRIRVVWEALTTDGYGHDIMICELDLDGNITFGPTTLMAGWEGYGEAKPIIAITPDVVSPIHFPNTFHTLVAWHDVARSALRGVLWNSDNTISLPTDLLGDVAQFTLAPFSNTANVWHLAYIENNSLFYVPVSVGSPPTVGSSQMIAEGDEAVYYSSPTISVVSGTIGVAWQAFYWEFVTGTVKYSEHISGQTWSNPTNWVPYYTNYYQKPNITSNPLYQNAILVWQSESPSMYTVRGRPGNWTSVVSVGTGVDPTLSAGHYATQSGEYLVSRGTTAPYAIQRQGISTADESEERDSMPETAEGRGGRLMFRNGSLHIAVLDVQANDMRLGFAEMNDTARINLSQFENVFSTEPFAGTGTLKLTTLFTAKGQLPNGISIRMMLRDAATGNVVQNLRTFHVGDDTLVTFQAALNHGSRQLKLVLQPVGVAQLSRIDLERWYVVDEAASMAKQLANTTTLGGLPEVFALHPNYPNPFNPTTTIKYDLPEASHVSLVVYDLLGRKVTELVSGGKSEGYHSAIWDASNVASGVYFARCTATDGSGNVRLNKVSKLLLTK